MLSRAKSVLKRMAYRAMRPGMQDALASLGAMEARLARLSGHLGITDDAAKYESELAFWVWLVRGGGCEQHYGRGFRDIYGEWQRERIRKLGRFLGLEPWNGDADASIDAWCAKRTALEIGSGPYPSIAAARWVRAMAIDPIAKGYTEKGLVPPEAAHVCFVEAPGERLPVAAGSFDVVVCENCLDHVANPAAVVSEVRRVLAPGGHFWFQVDLSHHTDHMHPHALDEHKVRDLLSAFRCVREEVSANKAHPEAYGEYRALLMKPPPPATTTTDQRAEAAEAVEQGVAQEMRDAVVVKTTSTVGTHASG